MVRVKLWVAIYFFCIFNPYVYKTIENYNLFLWKYFYENYYNVISNLNVCR